MLSPERKAPPRKGRRALDDVMSGTDDLIESFANSVSLSPQERSPSSPAPPLSRKTGVWGDETVKSGKSRRSSTNLIEQERFQSPERLKRMDSDDDIPLIPEIEDVLEDPLDDVAEAPMIPMSKLESYSELTSELQKQSFTVLEDVNLGALSKYLYAETDLREADTKWTWDLLFTEVSSELRLEKEDKSS